MLELRKAAILGATGPTGKHLARELSARGVAVRAVSRSAAHLDRAFGADGPAVERVATDALDAAATVRAVEGCDVVFDCIGLPMDRIADHPPTARNVAAAVARTGARAVHVSSYWAYVPIRRTPLTEDHPRAGGGLPVRMRREAEDILQGAGAAVVNLPDFYGPEVHTSTLQNALAEAAAGRTVNWLGAPDTPREYVYVPDAMRAIADLAAREQAYGERWIVAGAGPIPLTRVVELAERHLGRPVRVRSAGPLTVRVLGLFNRQLRELMPLVPTYVRPIAYDGAKLRGLIGEIPTTPYEAGIPRTLDWLAERGTGSGPAAS
ncbi:MAG TPA: NAD(P)H-binding protein [Geminicoccaceae bacterium]|nr:NAD(P)H-binding protein [Geminicoccaceae bacterium]